MGMTDLYQMVSGIGDGFEKSYDSARQRAFEEQAPAILDKLFSSQNGGGASLDNLTAAYGQPAQAASAGSDGAPTSRSLPTFAQGSDIGRYASAIQGNESGGNYGIVGPTHKRYGRALGAYQVMESNLPSWSQEAIGRVVSPEEFLKTPAIQDAIFQKKFGQAVEKYGNPQDAASVWFTGRPLAQGSNARDVLGTTGQRYVDMFNAGLRKAGGPAPGQAPALPATAMQMPGAPAAAPAGPTMVLPASAPAKPVQVANTEAETQALEQRMGMMPPASAAPAPASEEADKPVANAKPISFVIPPGQSAATPPVATPVAPPAAAAPSAAAAAPGFAGFGNRASRMTPEYAAALQAAWKNPVTRPYATQIYGQLMKGADSSWSMTDLGHGRKALIEAKTGRIVPIPGMGDHFSDVTDAEGNQFKVNDVTNERFLVSKAEKDDGAKITSQAKARQAEVEARGINPADPRMLNYILTGSLPADRPDHDEGAKITSQIEARKAQAGTLGLVEGTPAWQSFVGTGKIGRDQDLSATDKKAIQEADEGVLSANTAIDALKQAKELSPKAYSGLGAGFRGSVASMGGYDGGVATEDLKNIVTTNALGQLKAIFGGNPTEGERAILLDIQGSVNQPDVVRQKIFDRGIALAQKRLEFNQRRADDLRGGTYYKQDRAAADPTAAPAASGGQRLASPPSLPVRVTPTMTPEIIMKRFPKGTRLILPDGSEGVVP